MYHEERYTESELWKKRVEDLKDILRENNLKVSGLKED